MPARLNISQCQSNYYSVAFCTLSLAYICACTYMNIWTCHIWQPCLRALPSGNHAWHPNLYFTIAPIHYLGEITFSLFKWGTKLGGNICPHYSKIQFDAQDLALNSYAKQKRETQTDTERHRHTQRDIDRNRLTL